MPFIYVPDYRCHFRLFVNFIDNKDPDQTAHAVQSDQFHSCQKVKKKSFSLLPAEAKAGRENCLPESCTILLWKLSSLLTRHKNQHAVSEK